MWSDSETDIDFLNYSEVAELIAELIKDPRLLPLSLGVFGGWGTGKSTTLKLVQLELARNPKDFLVVKFDAWLYQDFDDARAALMGVISSSIIENAPPNLKNKAIALLERVNKLRLLGLLLEGGALAMGAPTFGVISKGIESVGTLLGGEPASANVDAIKSGGAEIVAKASNLLHPNQEDGGPPAQIDAFRSEFGELMEDLNKTLVVFIDNIDRCLPANAIHTLEAVRLFLFMPKTAFVVAADEDMIRHAVAHHFHNPSQRHVADYLDKLIQIPIKVPRVGIQEVRAYLFLLLCSGVSVPDAIVEELRTYLMTKLRSSWSKDGEFSVQDVLAVLNRSSDDEIVPIFEMADRMAPTLALSPGVSGNPRIVKRMLNVVRMRTSVARRRSMPLDEAMIAKLALFERCTDNAATEELHNLIYAAPEGKPALFAELERGKTDQPTPTLPEILSKHSSFLLEWSKLPPALEGVDLRPAVYLARETIPLRMPTVSSSAAALHAIENLSKVTSVSSPAGKAALDALRPEELVVVMDALIGDMRKNSAWNRTRSDFRGAVMTADRSEDAAVQLSRFVRSLQLPKMPGWMTTMLKGRSWWQE